MTNRSLLGSWYSFLRFVWTGRWNSTKNLRKSRNLMYGLPQKITSDLSKITSHCLQIYYDFAILQPVYNDKIKPQKSAITLSPFATLKVSWNIINVWSLKYSVCRLLGYEAMQEEWTPGSSSLHDATRAEMVWWQFFERWNKSTTTYFFQG